MRSALVIEPRGGSEEIDRMLLRLTCTCQDAAILLTGTSARAGRATCGTADVSGGGHHSQISRQQARSTRQMASPTTAWYLGVYRTHTSSIHSSASL